MQALIPIHYLPNPTQNPKATVEKIQAFLEALHAYPGGPNVCSSAVTFRTQDHKINWIHFYAFAIVMIKRPGVHFGKDVVEFDASQS